MPRFEGELSFLSNFAPAEIHDLTYAIRYPTVEHYYQAQKTQLLHERTYIVLLPTPGQAKRGGRSLTIRVDWHQIKIAVMMEGIRQKFTNKNEYGNKLIEVDPSLLIEHNNWHDNFWGICQCERCERLTFLPDYMANWLGRLLVIRRQQLLLER